MNEPVVGIVAEYNPFHNGHLRCLREAKARTGAETCVAVMSGDFTQRGEPALFDKWKRAEAAVDNGIDLVAELPFLYACNHAEHFARGAVTLLERMGCVTHLAFGSESGDAESLKRTARLLADESAAFGRALRAHAKRGLSFPRARCEALRETGGDAAAACVSAPNDLLAVEYLKQIRRVGSRMEPTPVKRAGAGRREANPEAGVAGASALRELYAAGAAGEAARYLPQATRDALAGVPPAHPEGLYTLIAYAARTRGADALAEILSAAEGLENRVAAAADGARDLRSLTAGVKSKRYTETRVNRFLIHILFGVSKAAFADADADGPLYLRPLAMNDRGAALLRRVKRAGALVTVTNPARARGRLPASAAAMLAYDVLAADVYNLAFRGAMGRDSDFRTRPYLAGENGGAGC